MGKRLETGEAEKGSPHSDLKIWSKKKTKTTGSCTANAVLAKAPGQNKDHFHQLSKTTELEFAHSTRNPLEKLLLKMHHYFFQRTRQLKYPQRSTLYTALFDNLGKMV